jgi:hypothetical protein
MTTRSGGGASRGRLLYAALACIVLAATIAAWGRPAQAQAATCQVTYTVSQQWGDGFTADVSIRNTGAAINGWTLTWTFSGNQTITNMWNAVRTQSGQNVSARDGGWNASLPTGGSAGFGFQASFSGSNVAPTSFALNGAACNGGSGSPTSTPTRTATGPTNTATRTSTPTRTATTGPTSMPTRTPTTGPTSTPIQGGTPFTGNATFFDALGSPYGGCGLPQSVLDSQNFVALNVQDTPGDYSTFFQRPISAQNASKIGMFANGLNCGRWVRVTIGNFCNGINDGAPNRGFCHDGTGWVSDQYNGAVLDMLVADSCQDGNGWCRDDKYHLDLAKNSLNLFVKNGQPVGDMYPNHWNNRQIQWQFIEAPSYQGDIQIGFLQGASIFWSAISISHLRNGLHGVEYLANGTWQKATMNSDMGQSYIIAPTATNGNQYSIRITDAADLLINNGRVYSFSFPTACGQQCGPAYTAITYTAQ